MLISILLVFLTVNISFAEKKEAYDNGGQQKQQYMLRRHRDAVRIIPSSDNYGAYDAFGERQMKRSKSSKSSKGTKSTKKSYKSTKSSKLTKSIEKDVVDDCRKVESYQSNGSRLETIIAAMVQEQDFSSYCQDDFDVAKTWFLNLVNHPTDGKENDDEYMKERFNLALTYSANCKEGCTLSTNDWAQYNWLSASDHCIWGGVLCNNEHDIIEIYMGGGLTGQFTMFGLQELTLVDLAQNNLSGDFIVAGESPNLKKINLDFNNITGFVGGGILKNLEQLRLGVNELKEDLEITAENFPTSIRALFLGRNKLTGFVGGGILTNLGYVYLDGNAFDDDFIITEENFPASIVYLFLQNNKLTGFVGGGILRNLDWLNLENNMFKGILNITEEDFSSSISQLHLQRNQLTGFIGGDILTNLKLLYLNENQFQDDLFIEAKNFPAFVTHIIMNGNTGLISIDAEANALPNLQALPVYDIEGVIVKKELCTRPGLNFPEGVCE